MIYLIVGENEYRARQELRQLEKSLKIRAEKLDVEALDLNKLADAVRGLSLFQEERLIVVRELSAQKNLWDKLGEWATDVAPQTHLVLIERRPDKRTKTYKILRTVAKVIEAAPLTERDRLKAEAWLIDYAQKMGVELTRQQANAMVARAIVREDGRSSEIDQLQLAHAVTALRGVKKIDDATISAILPPAREFSVFDILELAAQGKLKPLKKALGELRSDDPYKIAPLIWSQWSQLVALAMTNDESAAKDLGIHPFVAKKMRVLARRFSHDDLKKYTELAAKLDAEMKTSNLEPWLALEDFLLTLAARG